MGAGDVTTAVQELMKLGFAGVVIFFLYRMYSLRDQNYREVQEKRIAESHETTDKVLTAINASTQALNTATKAFSEALILIRGDK